ncbi:MAG TPA: hypothetical protein VGC56_10660 [Allosphingosinicella sp.]|jgi:hypothetical protein
MGLFGNSEERALRREELRLLQERHNALFNEANVVDGLIASKREAAAKMMDIEAAANAPKWEYRVDDDLEPAALSALGSKGWELVGLTSYATGGGVGGDSFMMVHVRFALKRALLENYSEEVQGVLGEITDLDTRINEIRREAETVRREINGY